MQKDFITVTPDNGTGNAKVNCSVVENNTENDRNTTFTISGGGINRTVSVSQEGKREYLINIRPSNYATVIPVTESDTAFTVNVYKIDPADGSLISSTYSQLLSELAANTATDVKINWSPFGSSNYCDYVFNRNNGTTHNPDASNVLATVTLNIKSVSGLYYYNMKQAAFHQGSPIVEIAFESGSSKPKILTMSALQKALYGNHNYMSFQAIRDSTWNTLSITNNTTQICTESTCLITVDGYLEDAGRCTLKKNGYKLVSTGVSRMYVIPNTNASSGKIQALKWFGAMDGTNELKGFVTVWDQADLYTPQSNPVYPISLLTATWTTSRNPVAMSSSLMNVNSYYNPS